MPALGAALANFGMPFPQADISATDAVASTPCGPELSSRSGAAALPRSQNSACDDAEHASLIACVKAEQKSSADVRARWRDYCDVLGNGTRDPGLHDAAFLRAFFDLLVAGHVPEPLHNRPLPGPGLCPGEAHAVLAAKVQHGQHTAAFKKAWATFCDTQRLGTRDPLRYDNESLRHFLLNVVPDGKGFPCKDPYAQPPQHVSPLSECVRGMQSKKIGWKNQWDQFSETRGGGVRDPARHREDILLEFILAAKPRCPAKMLPQKYRVLPQSGRTAALGQALTGHGLEGAQALEPMTAPKVLSDSDCSTDGGSMCSFPGYIEGCDGWHSYNYISEAFDAQASWSL